MSNPYEAPQSDVATTPSEPLIYVGFWLRAAAYIADLVLVSIITLPIAYIIYGSVYFDSTDVIQGPIDFILTYVFPVVATIIFWVVYGATPGKMLIGAKIVDAETGEAASTGQLIGRYVAYIPSSLVLLLGFFWIGWDERKQGWHDKLAKTVVIKRAV